MSERAATLAHQFEQTSDEFLKLVSGVSEQAWSQPFGNGDHRSFGVVAHHVGTGYDSTIGAVMALIGGTELNLTWEMIHDGNAAHADLHHHVTRDATLALLRENGARTLETLRRLTDSQLDTQVNFGPFGDAPIPAQAVIEGLVIGHVGMHSRDFGA